MADLLFTLKLQVASLDQHSGPLFTTACLQTNTQSSCEERVRVGSSLCVDSSEWQRQRQNICVDSN